MNDVGLILISHGSESPKHKESIEKIAAMLKARSKFKIVETAYMIKNKPTIEEAIEKVANQGAKKAVLIPVFIASGNHTEKDIPEKLGLKNGERKTRKGSLEIIYGEPIGPDMRLAEIIEEKALKALGLSVQHISTSGSYRLEVEESIFEASMEKIRGLLGDYLSSLPAPHAKIVERVVHATADPEFAKLIVISDNAVDAGINAIRSGAKVITDVKMVKAGISEDRLRRFGCQLLCYVDDERALKLASERGMTRSAAAMRLAAEEGLNNAIIVIGNAPTAAFELAKTVKAEEVKPALIIAAPVGFMGAAESKEEIMQLNVPFIAVRGPKGGSPIAAAIFNALLAMAEHQAGIKK
ncbi:precorrin-8X methylmutase [Candidatus Bathyarchaeota archaeon]|nr:precorrin-8X methylmutase [Candidatus Bathyarchaeota archaeon]